MKRLIKKVTAVIMAMLMLFASVTVAHGASGAQGELPLRAVFEDVGAFVDWVDGIIMVVMPNGDEWAITPGGAAATLNSESVELVAPVIIIDGRAFISYADAMLLLGVSGPAPRGELALTIETAMATAPAFMNAVGVTGLTMAIVDAETGFTWTQGFGYADSVRGLPVDEHTLFQVGSTSKPFTAAAVMQLVEQGLIDLDSPVVNYLPEFSILPSPVLGGDSGDVTVRMLLNNTSGVPANKLYGWFITGDSHYQGNMNNLLEWLQTRELTFEPGTMYEYSNNNWSLLGIIVARLMGFDNYFEGFIEYTNTNIFTPLGMERSTFEFTPGLTNVAMPYISLGVQDIMHTVSPIAAGSVLSSAYEMALFMHTIFGDGTMDGHRLLTQETLAYMMQEHSIMSPGVLHYGLGFMRVIAPGGRVLVGHDGNIAHYHTGMMFDPETGLGVFVSVNTTSGLLIATHLAITMLETAITEKTGAPPWPQPPEPDISDVGPATLSAEELAFFSAFEGLYDFAEAGGIWELLIIDGVLTWDAGFASFELIPLSDGTFDSIAGIYSFEFVDGVAVATITVGDEQFSALRIDGLEDVAPPEGFLDWVGVYNFVPQVENEVGLIWQLVVSVNEFGFPMMSTEQAIHAYLGGPSEIPLAEYNGYWFFGFTPVRFIIDDDGNRFIDILGGLYVRS
ncbi:MAG: serine hydrolase [Defluviitaleaceae bacterium]|nr:serine hydrolase [Defluviitaleaceae bacterium]